MAARDRPTVFHMRRLARGKVPNVREVLTPASVERHPVRDLQKLQRAVDRHDDIVAIARELDAEPVEVQRWCEIYGLDLGGRE